MVNAMFYGLGDEVISIRWIRLFNNFTVSFQRMSVTLELKRNSMH